MHIDFCGSRRLGFVVAIVVGLAVAIAVAGCGADDGVKPVNTAANGLAVHGYDPVAYFADNRAVAGSAAFELAWNGATWRFASGDNRAKFEREPERYAPQFGGYCSYAVSRGYTADADPEAWRIVDGKLYLNYDKDVAVRWAEDLSGNIEKASLNWPTFLVHKPEHKG